MDQSPTSVLETAPTPAVNSFRCCPYTCVECIEMLYTRIELFEMSLICCPFTCGWARDAAPTPVMLPLHLRMDQSPTSVLETALTPAFIEMPLMPYTCIEPFIEMPRPPPHLRMDQKICVYTCDRALTPVDGPKPHERARDRAYTYGGDKHISIMTVCVHIARPSCTWVLALAN